MGGGGGSGGLLVEAEGETLVPRGGGGVALVDEEGDVLLAEALGEGEAGDAGADDEDFLLGVGHCGGGLSGSGGNVAGVIWWWIPFRG